MLKIGAKSVNSLVWTCTSATSLKDAKFELILQDAKEFLKPIRSCNKTTDAMEIINIDDADDDERAHLIDNSGDESDWLLELRKCMSLFFFKFWPH